jgi:hypothetical protein
MTRIVPDGRLAGHVPTVIVFDPDATVKDCVADALPTWASVQPTLLPGTGLLTLKQKSPRRCQVPFGVLDAMQRLRALFGALDPFS